MADINQKQQIAAYDAIAKANEIMASVGLEVEEIKFSESKDTSVLGGWSCAAVGDNLIVCVKE